MVQVKRGALALLAGLLMSGSAFAEQRSLVLNTDASDPAPKAAFDQLIAAFEAENPDIKVTVNMFDHEGYKTAIRNFLTADSPDLANWYAATAWPRLSTAASSRMSRMSGRPMACRTASPRPRPR